MLVKYGIVLSEVLKTFFLVFIFSIQIGTIWGQDITPPDAPIIDSVTVLWANPTMPNGDILITWQKSDSADVKGYYIKYLNEVLGTYKLLDSVDFNTTSYLDTKLVTDPFYPQTYVVQAYDYAANTSNHSAPHQTIRVFPWQKNESCQVKVELSWNAYQGFPEGMASYDLYATDGTTTTHLGHFAGNQLSHVQAFDGQHYAFSYFVRGTSVNGKTSTSNKIPFTPNLPVFPSYIDVVFASVIDKAIDLSFSLDSIADVRNYRLVRSTDNANNFTQIALFQNYNRSTLRYTDQAVEVNSHRYYYQLHLLDNCSNPIDSSIIVSPVLLKGTADKTHFYNELVWTDYFTGINNDKNYNLYRTSTDLLPVLIESSTSNFDFTDDLSTQLSLSFAGDFCYYIQAYDSTTHSLSMSNRVCLAQDPRLTMPTIFSPTGLLNNRYFKPIFSFIAPHPYYFVIFDRWGQKIFETHDYRQAWDGTSNGHFAAAGLYSYYLEYASSEGKIYKKSGNVNLMY